MSVTPRFRLLAAVALLAPTLAACSVSFGAQTDQPYDPTRGVSDQTGDVDALDVLIVSGVAGSGTVSATLVNGRPVADTLTAVEVDGKAATIKGGSVAIPPQQHANLGASGDVTASADAIVPGVFLDVTFTFENAEAVTVNVPVIPPNGAFASVPLPEG